MDAVNTCLEGHDCSAGRVVYPRMCEYGEWLDHTQPTPLCQPCPEDYYCADDALVGTGQSAEVPPKEI